MEPATPPKGRQRISGWSVRCQANGRISDSGFRRRTEALDAIAASRKCTGRPAGSFTLVPPPAYDDDMARILDASREYHYGYRTFSLSTVMDLLSIDHEGASHIRSEMLAMGLVGKQGQLWVLSDLATGNRSPEAVRLARAAAAERQAAHA